MKLITFFKIVGQLKKIKRTGWVIKGVQDPESVADHVYRTCFMCMILSQKRQLDHLKLLRMALLHDLGETATSDIRFEEGTKIIASPAAKNRIEEDILKKILPSTGNSDYYLQLYHEFRDQSSPEAKFLKQVEKLEMVIQALEYQEYGTPSHALNEFFENARKYIADPKIATLLKQTISLRKKIK